MNDFEIAATVALLFVSCFSGLCEAQVTTTAPATTMPNKYGIILGKDTTVLTGPLRADGTIDFIKALNDRGSRDVTPENNAANLLVRIVPRDGVPKDPAWARILDLLGVPENSHDEIIWRDWPGFHKAGERETDEEERKYENAEAEPWSADEMPQLVEWLKANDRAIELAIQASSRPRYWFPIVPVSDSDPLLMAARPPEFAFWNCVMQALCIRGMLKLNQNDYSGAWRDLLAVHRLSHLVAGMPFFLDNECASNWQREACGADLALLHHEDLTFEQLRGMLKDLEAIDGVPDPRGDCGQTTRFEFIEAVEKVATASTGEWLKHFENAESANNAERALTQAGLPLPDWNRILRLGNAWYDDFLVNDWQLPPNQMEAHRKDLRSRMDAMTKVWREADPLGISQATVKDQWLWPRPGESQAAYSDRLGTVILCGTLPSLTRASDYVRSSNANLEWVKAVMNLAIYRKEKGHYPSSIDDLIPAYLPKPPISPSTRPVQYKAIGSGYEITNLSSIPSHANSHLEPDQILIQVDK